MCEIKGVEITRVTACPDHIVVSVPSELKGIQKYAKNQLQEVHPALLNDDERIY